MEILELCNNCGNKILPPPELVNMKVVHINGKGIRKEQEIKCCMECYGHILKYPLDDFGFYKVDSDFKLYYLKIKKLYTEKNKKNKGDLIIPTITVKGKEQNEVFKPWVLGESKNNKKKKEDNFYNNLNKLLGRKPEIKSPFTNYNS